MAGIDLKFGPYELKSRVRQLHKHGVKLRLRPQSFRVLEILLERPGDLVTREEFETVRQMAAKARDEQEALLVRIASLEAKLGEPVEKTAVKPKSRAKKSDTSL